jgi:hypothetical protein
MVLAMPKSSFDSEPFFFHNTNALGYRGHENNRRNP